MRNRSSLICFTGIDGSGKTTHAKSLIKHLDENGCSCKYVWGASRPFLSYIFFVFTKILGYWKKTRKNAYTDPLEYAPKNVANKLGIIWRFFLFLDFHIKTAFVTRLPLILGKTVICDRYFYDLLMELQLSNVSTERFIRMLSKTLPQPLITFLLDVPETLANQRRGFPLEELAAKRKVFLQMGKTFDLVIVDSSKNFLNNQKRIRTLTCMKLKMWNN
jgi:dTMP kinase